jgi:ankyrin repeat protein
MIILLMVLLFSLNLLGMSEPPLFTVAINTAAATGNLEQLKELIKQHGTELDRENAAVALWCALNKNQFETAEFLTTSCVDVNVCVSEYETLLERISRTKNVSVVKWLLEHGADPDFCSKGNITRLAQLCEVGDLENAYDITLQEMELLCMYGADPNATTGLEMRCLHSLMQKPLRNRFEMIALIISAGANINTPRDIGITPLHTACYKDMNTVVAYLLNKGAKKDAQNTLCRTPLEYVKFNPDLYAMLTSDILPPMSDEALKAEKKLKQKIA